MGVSLRVTGRVAALRVGRVGASGVLVRAVAGGGELVTERSRGEGPRPRQRGARGEVPDLELGQDVRLQRRPGHDVVGGRGRVLRLEVERESLAVTDVGVHEPVGR